MEKREVDITFDENNNFFRLYAKDGKNVLSGSQAKIIRDKGWIAASDGHTGLYAIVCAPKNERSFLESLFVSSVSHDLSVDLSA